MSDAKKDSYFKNTRPEMLGFIPSGIKTLLDVGCGAGRFAFSVKQRYNCEVWGIEPNSQFASEANGILDKVINNVYTGEVEQIEGKQFDCIVFNDVLEHMEDPWKILKASRSNLTNQGVVVASIPNLRFWEVLWGLLIKGSFTYTESGILDSTHLRFFTRKEMIKLFEDTGYDIINIEGINAFRGKKWRIFNFIFLNRFWDCQFLQFAVVAKKR
ncbi:MAG: class I SAM-dependent methyltransferase [Rhodospirillales bacterium]|nr:class I SAM-dependent methyltransferase [Rhodospirillales bacterium]